MQVGDIYPVKYEGTRPLVSFSDGNSPTDLPRGYYPIKSDGSVDPTTRLRLVDDSPGTDGDEHHFEVMPSAAGVGYYHGAHDGEAEKIVALDAAARGKAHLSFGEKLRAKINYIIGRPS